MISVVLASTDWVAIASVATAAATLVLATATFSSVRSANRTARAAEQSLAAQLWPLLAPAKSDDPEQKVMFQDRYKVMVPGGQGAAEATPDAVYLAIAIRNYGPGLAILDRWSYGTGRKLGTVGPDPESSFRRLTRDLYVAPGDVGFWQGAIRDPADPAFAEATAAINRREEMTIEMLYSDHLGNQRTVSRFVMFPGTEGRWIVTASRHFNLDRPDPR
jgi:hypothetical protein